MSIYDKATEEWFSKRPGQESTVEQCDQCGLYYKPSLGHKCKVKAEEKTMTVKETTYEEAIEIFQRWQARQVKNDYVKGMHRAVEKAIEALEKQMPKKPIDEYHRTAYCPACGNLIIDTYCCPECGQKIDWSEINDD